MRVLPGRRRRRLTAHALRIDRALRQPLVVLFEALLLGLQSGTGLTGRRRLNGCEHGAAAAQSVLSPSAGGGVLATTPPTARLAMPAAQKPFPRAW